MSGVVAANPLDEIAPTPGTVTSRRASSSWRCILPIRAVTPNPGLCVTQLAGQSVKRRDRRSGHIAGRLQ